MTVETTPTGGPTTAMAIGVGLWVFFGWCWVTAQRRRRGRLVAAFGLVVAAAFGGGVLVSLLDGTVGLSSVGALSGAGLVVAGGLVWRRAATLPLVDHLVAGGLAGLSVARIGCLFEGCDFGRPTDLGPAVVYGDETRAWAVHVAEYGLATNSAESLAVHPFAAYLAGWGLICAGIGEWLRRRGGPPGRAGAVAAIAFLVGGGAIEWLREPVTVWQLAEGWSVYPVLYWLGAGVVAAGWWQLTSGAASGDAR